MTARSAPASSINGTSFSMVNGSGICGFEPRTHGQSADSAFHTMDLRVNDQALARGLNGRRLSRSLIRSGRRQTGAERAVEKAAA